MKLYDKTNVCYKLMYSYVILIVLKVFYYS